MGGKQGGIFDEWFRNLSSLIFLQSFHAIFLAFTCEIIGAISNAGAVTNTKTLAQNTEAALGGNDGILAIMTIVSIMSLIKMEKMVKGIFGIKDSKFLGGIGENLSKSMAGIGSAVSMAKRTTEPFKERAKSKKQYLSARKSRVDAQGKLDDKTKAYNDLKATKPVKGETESNEDYRDRVKDHRRKLENAKKEMSEAEGQVHTKRAEEEKSKADYDVKGRQAYMRLGSTVASTGFAIGGAQDMASAATLANLVDMPLDAMSDSYSKRTGYGKAAKRMDENIDNEKQKMARDRVKSSHPGLSETDPAFQQEVSNLLNDEDFQNEANKKLKGMIDAKFQIDLDIPENSVKRVSKDIAQEWRNATEKVKHPITSARNGGTAKDVEEREGREYSKKVRKQGITYKGQQLDDLM